MWRTLANFVNALIAALSNITSMLSTYTDRQVLDMLVQGQWEMQQSLDYIAESLGCDSGFQSDIPQDIEDLRYSLDGQTGVDDSLRVLVGALQIDATHIDSQVDDIKTDTTAIDLATDTIESTLDTIYAAITGLPVPPPDVATPSDVARILSAIYYVAVQPYALVLTVDNEAVLDAITASIVSFTDQHVEQNADLDDIHADVGTLAGVVSNVHDDLVADTATITGDVATLQAAADVIDGIVDLIHGTDVPAIQADIAAIEPGGGTPSGYPGYASVTLGSPANWSGPGEINTAMDGCFVAITTQASGTGRHEVGDHTSWQHAGWLAFVDDQGNADELQWLNFDAANYCPKRLASASSVLIFPRAGSSGTLTPWTRNA